MIDKQLCCNIGHNREGTGSGRLSIERSNFRRAASRLIFDPSKGWFTGSRQTSEEQGNGTGQKQVRIYYQCRGEIGATLPSTGNQMSLFLSEDPSSNPVQHSVTAVGLDPATESSVGDHLPGCRSGAGSESLGGILAERINCSASTVSLNADLASSVAIKQPRTQQFKNTARPASFWPASPRSAQRADDRLLVIPLSQFLQPPEALASKKQTTSGGGSGVSLASTVSSLTARVPSPMPEESLKRQERRSTQASETPRRPPSTTGPSKQYSPTVPETVRQSSGNYPTRTEMSPYGYVTAPPVVHPLDVGCPSQVKRLCSQCRQGIIGLKSVCLSCLQATDAELSRSSPAKSPAKDHSYNSETLIADEAVSPPNPNFCRASDRIVRRVQSSYQAHRPRETTGGSGRALIARKTTFPSVSASPLSRRNEKNGLHSPCVPETPELVSTKPKDTKMTRSTIAQTAYKQQASSEPPGTGKKLDPVSGSAHCFTKKTTRTFKSIKISKPSNLTPAPGNRTCPINDPDVQIIAVRKIEKPVVREASPKPMLSIAADDADASSTAPISLDPDLNQLGTQNLNKARIDGIQDGSFSSGKSEAQELGQSREYAVDGAQYSEKAKTLDRVHPSAGSEEPPCIQKATGVEERGLVPDDSSTFDGNNLPVVIRGGTNPAASKRKRGDNPESWEGLPKHGIRFEEDSGSDSIDGVEFDDLDTPVGRDPLRCRPHSSLDLFAIAPHLHPRFCTFDIEQKRREIDARPPRKQRRLNASYLRQERGEDIHQEVNLYSRPQMVSAHRDEDWGRWEVDDRNTEWRGTEEMEEVEMTFTEFIGAPVKPMAILTRDGNLAFRDGSRDARGVLPRAREIFVKTDRSSHR